jgi:hypothetical protein
MRLATSLYGWFAEGFDSRFSRAISRLRNQGVAATQTDANRRALEAGA